MLESSAKCLNQEGSARSSSMVFDFYPTPATIARRVAAASSISLPKLVADFSAGDGSLLRAASDRWPSAVIIATDIQSKLVRQIKAANPTWIAGTCDFLLERSVRSCKSLAGRQGAVDLVLLNPPFSMRGQAVARNSRPVPSIALRFLLRATAYASPHAEICAILPISSLYGEKDRSARLRLERDWSIHLVEKLPRGSFPGCFAEAAIVRLSRKLSEGEERSTETPTLFSHATITRGRVHVHTVKPKRGGPRVEFIHSTNLTNSRVSRSGLHVDPVQVITGPAILIHRVGRPSKSKVCMLEAGRRVQLSDCVIAIQAQDREEIESIFEALMEHYATLKSAYIGTGAPFITVSRLNNLLSTLLK